MDLLLRTADEADAAFCEALNRRNMGGYLARRGIDWDPGRFRASWDAFENLLILDGRDVVGLLRLASEDGALGLRDLQVLPARQGQGIGSWAVRQAQAIAVQRGHGRLQLRVYRENPAAALYARLGFQLLSEVGDTLQMTWSPGSS